MWVYVVRRMVWLPFLMLVASLIVFTLGRFGPGDPVMIIMGNKYDPDSIAAKNIRHELGLDRPFHVQYSDYMWGFVRGDFGESTRFRGQSVRNIILPKMWVSAQLALVSTVIVVFIGLPLGFFIAHRQGSWIDPTIVSLSVILMSIPVMVTVPALLWVLCLKVDLIRCSGWGGILDLRIVVPVISSGLFAIAPMLRLMRASTLDVMGQDFVRTAYSKGLSQAMVDYRHILKNALIPIVTVLAFSIAGLLSGSFITETIMGIPGIGRFVVESVFNRDYPVIMAVTMIGAAAFGLSTLLADLAYAFIDPRIRYQ